MLGPGIRQLREPSPHIKLIWQNNSHEGEGIWLKKGFAEEGIFDLGPMAGMRVSQGHQADSFN